MRIVLHLPVTTAQPKSGSSVQAEDCFTSNRLHPKLLLELTLLKMACIWGLGTESCAFGT